MKISVIVPVYNTEKFLARCLDSLVQQTIKDIEIIIVNDGSIDSSQNIINEFVKTYPNKILAFSQQNAGQSVARNFALKHVSGDYITFVDSDDWLERNALELLYDSIISINSDIAVCDINIYRQDTPESTNFLELFRTNKYLAQKFVWGKLYKSDFWKKNKFKFYEGIFYEDLELLPKVLFMTNKISIVDCRLYNYELRNETSTTKLVKNSEYFLLIFKQMIEFYKDKQKDKKFEKQLCNMMFGFFMEYERSKLSTEEIFKNNKYLLKLGNGVNLYQNILIIFIRAGIPLSFLYKVLKLRKKIKTFYNKCK